jgi:hypothetical protein
MQVYTYYRGGDIAYIGPFLFRNVLLCMEERGSAKPPCPYLFRSVSAALVDGGENSPVTGS